MKFYLTNNFEFIYTLCSRHLRCGKVLKLFIFININFKFCSSSCLTSTGNIFELSFNLFFIFELYDLFSMYLVIPAEKEIQIHTRT